MEKVIEQKPRNFSYKKATDLCYSSIFDLERLNIEQTIVRKQYEPFINYIDFALEAARKKTNSAAEFSIVDRDNDYKLTPWLLIKIKTKQTDKGQLVSEEEAPTLEKFGQTILPISPNNITVNNKSVEFYKITGGFVCKADANASVVIDGNPDIKFDVFQYLPEKVVYKGHYYPVKKKIISVPNFDESITTCTDSNYESIVFDIRSDDKDQRPGEITLELKDNASSDVSVYDLFCSEEASEVYFDNPNIRYKIRYRNKESGRIVIQCRDDISKFKEVHLCANTIQLARQKDALNIIVKRPSRFQQPLISLAKRRMLATFERFNDFAEEKLDYIVLTNISRAGTKSQRDFVQKALHTPDFMILQGPPGSGKTTAILELIYQLAKKGKKVLLCASTHVAVDNVLEKIISHPNHEELLKIIRPVRVGKEDLVYSECVKPFVYSNLMENVDSDYSNLVSESFNLVCGTAIGVQEYPLIKNKITEATHGSTLEPMFDYLILDEASKTTFNEFLVPAVMCKHWIITGDVKQLAPYIEKADLVPSLLNCKPIANVSKRMAVSFIRNKKERDDKQKQIFNKAYLYPFEAIELINKHYLKETTNLVTVTMKPLPGNNVTLEDIKNNGYKTTLLSTERSVFLIQEDIISDVLPLLSKNIEVLSQNLNPQKDECFPTYQILKYRDAFPEKYEKDLEDFSRKLEDEILWRLIRLCELNETQASAQNYNKWIESVYSVLPEEECQELKNTINTLTTIAIPSIIKSLQQGIGSNNKFDSYLTLGFDEEMLKNRFVKLEYQHRMHPDISIVSRENVYLKQALKDSPSWKSHMKYPNERSRFEVRNVEPSPKDDGKNRNTNEAKAIMEELKMFVDYAKRNPKDDKSPYTIAILTFYNGQVNYLRELLMKFFGSSNKYNYSKDNIRVSLNTVDKFQGQEADIVYLSMVQSRRMGFLDSINRVNVGLTRAKEKIIVFGNKEFFTSDKQEQSDMLKKVFKEAI